MPKVMMTDPNDFALLFNRIYGVLRERAQLIMLDERRDHTLQATAVLHEAYLKIIEEQDGDQVEDQEQAIGRLVRRMRQVLVSHARRCNSLKRGIHRTTLKELGGPDIEFGTVEVHDAIEALEKRSPEHARIAELRLFGGLSSAEVAQIIGQSEPTARKHWKMAMAMLIQSIGAATHPTESRPT